MNELLPLYIDLLKANIINRDELAIGQYSTSSSRENMIYLYDLGDDTRTLEMNNLVKAGTEVNPEYFTCESSGLESIEDLYAVINDGEHRVVMYKHVIPVDKMYGMKSYFLGVNKINRSLNESDSI